MHSAPHTDQKFLLTGRQEPQCLSSAWLPRKGGLPERRGCHGAGASSADSQLKSWARVAGCWPYALPTQNALSVGQKSDAMPADSVPDLQVGNPKLRGCVSSRAHMCYREKAKHCSLSSAREQEDPQTGSYGDTHSAIAFWQESQQSGTWQPMRSDSRPYPAATWLKNCCVRRRERWSHIDVKYQEQSGWVARSK